MSKVLDFINNKGILYCTIGMFILMIASTVSDFYEKKGLFLAFVNDKEMIPPINRNILVYMDKDSTDLSEIDGIFPLIFNPARYALLDVLLKYTIEADSANISYSNGYRIDKTSNGERATNITDKLYAKSDLSSPFNRFVMKDNGQAKINLRATYQGVKDPFVYQSNIYTKRINKKENLTRERSAFIDADVFFSKNNDIDKIDLYILDNDSIAVFENFTKDSVYKRYSYNYGRMRGYKSRQNTELSSGLQAIDKGNMPWYMYIVGGLLGIFFALGAFFLLYLLIIILINDFQKKKSEFRYVNIVVFTVVSSVLSCIAFYYLMQVFFPEVINLNWQLIVCIYGINGTIIIVRLLIEKLFRTTKNQ